MAGRNQIVDGPGKFDLMISLFHGGVGNRTPVTFKMGDQFPWTVDIQGLTRLNKGDTDWFIICRTRGFSEDSWDRFTYYGQYNPRTRKGWLTLADSDSVPDSAVATWTTQCGGLVCRDGNGKFVFSVPPPSLAIEYKAGDKVPDGLGLIPVNLPAANESGRLTVVPQAKE